MTDDQTMYGATLGIVNGYVQIQPCLYYTDSIMHSKFLSKNCLWCCYITMNMMSLTLMMSSLYKYFDGIVVFIINILVNTWLKGNVALSGVHQNKHQIVSYCIVLYSSIYIAPLNSHRQTEAL